ncbi:hypothetical protein HK28_08190 [Acetobacter sp. DsW_063]|nr:hypothetical protein HK28_08190 [Acetobacter sp. DsW_063]
MSFHEHEASVCISRWNLIEDGAPLKTASSYLLPVTCDGVAAMLKITADPDEQRGAALMAWWGGAGAAPVLKHDLGVMLLERASRDRSLAALVYEGSDDDATSLLCATAARLHLREGRDAPSLKPLEDWFASLLNFSQTDEAWIVECSTLARLLLSEQSAAVPLHGDLHHGNILDFGSRGWLAIDPKALWGERTADYAAMFLNPDLADPDRPFAVDSGAFERRVRTVSSLAGLDSRRLLRWIQVWSGLSALWFLEDGGDPVVQRRIGELAARSLAQ